jgi:hypothetical protein
MHVIYGRPLAGKTKRIIDELNKSPGSSLFISLESPEILLRRRGLLPTVRVQEELSPDFLTKPIGYSAKVVALDSLELLNPAISISALDANLKVAGVERFLVTCHLRRDMRPASEERLAGLDFSSETL